MFNGVLLVAIIATWILKVTSLPKLYYKLFVDDEFINLVVAQTNLYAQQDIAKRLPSSSSRLQKWVPTNAVEMRKFLGLIMYMGLCRFGEIRDYWRSCELYTQNLAPKTMSRNRFQILLRSLHFEDNSKLDKNDRLGKISSLLTTMNRNFKGIFGLMGNFSFLCVALKVLTS